MTLLKQKFKRALFKRARPLLGTFVSITLENLEEENANRIFAVAFGEIKRLEKIFNFHDPNSALNQGLQENELSELSHFSLELFETTKGAFNPFANDGRLDLGGVAKGYIVDKVVQLLTQNDITLSGIVNAGGDLRIFGDFEKTIQLRLGTPDHPLFKSALISKSCVASTSLFGKKLNSKSNTAYRGDSCALASDCTAVSVAPQLQVADALTKVALFAEKQLTRAICKRNDTQVFIFDSQAQLVESFG